MSSIVNSGIVFKALMEDSLGSNNVYVLDLWYEVSSDGRDVVCINAFGKL